MTLIVGLCEDNKVFMGGDAATVWEGDARITLTRNPKVFRVGPLLFGSCGSGRVQNVLRGVTVPKRPRGVTAFDFIALHVTRAIRQALQEAGAIEREVPGAPDMMAGGSSVLIGYKGSLYQLGCDFSVDEARDDYDAIGAGATYALTVMGVTEGRPPRDRIMAALKHTAKHCWAVKGPFTVETL